MWYIFMQKDHVQCYGCQNYLENVVSLRFMGLDQRAKWGKLASTYIMLGEKCAVKFADEIIVLSEGVQNYF